MKYKILTFFIGSIILIVFQILFCDYLVSDVSRNHILEVDDSEIQKENIVLLLGTSKYLVGGKSNLYYANRIACAVSLYKKGKVRAFILSGDNGRKSYNEPDMMKTDLIRAGIPDSILFCDYAGFSTLDSVLRARYIFDCKTLLIVSQRFHIERAIYLAKRSGLIVNGVIAKDVPKWYNRTGNYREKLARVKAVMNVLLKTQPIYLGKKENGIRNILKL